MPDMSNTAAEIRAWAEERGIDIPSKATKAQALKIIGEAV